MASNEALRRELLEMRERDQEVRKTIFGRYAYGEPRSPEDSAWFKAVDAENTRRMQEIIAQHGWPGLSEVGEDGAGAAWILVQHADGLPDFQKRCLELIRAAVEAGEASGGNLAYLTDRVRIAGGLPQLYGTQGRWSEDGELGLWEIEDAATVDERRAALGLEPVAEYLVDLRRCYETKPL